VKIQDQSGKHVIGHVESGNMKTSEILGEKWSAKYKRSIDCNNPKGFSQRAHCAGRKKNEAVQQELPIDLDRIRDLIQRLESNQTITPQEADDMRRAAQALASGRDTILPDRLLQLLTMVA